LCIGCKIIIIHILCQICSTDTKIEIYSMNKKSKGKYRELF